MRHTILLTGIAGLLASIVVGTGEFLLHFDAQARFSTSGYDYMLDVSQVRTSAGHFIAVLGATLYPIGCYHLYLMLKPASEPWAAAAFLIGSFGFIVGAVWIGSRASVSALLPYQADATTAPVVAELIKLYEFRYENLLWLVRLSTLVISFIFVVLTVSGRTLYPKWMVLANPICLTIASFILFALNPAVGKFAVPIALNIAFAIFFVLSLVCAVRTAE